MIYKLIDLPSNLIGFKALWHITEKDFEEVLIPTVQDHVEKAGKLNGLIIINNSVKYISISPLKGLKNLLHWKTNWRRVAIVSESKSTKFFLNFLSTLFTGEFRVFSLNDLDQAIEWASQEN